MEIAIVIHIKMERIQNVMLPTAYKHKIHKKKANIILWKQCGDVYSSNIA